MKKILLIAGLLAFANADTPKTLIGDFWGYSINDVKTETFLAFMEDIEEPRHYTRDKFLRRLNDSPRGSLKIGGYRFSYKDIAIKTADLKNLPSRYVLLSVPSSKILENWGYEITDENIKTLSDAFILYGTNLKEKENFKRGL